MCINVVRKCTRGWRICARRKGGCDVGGAVVVNIKSSFRPRKRLFHCHETVGRECRSTSPVGVRRDKSNSSGKDCDVGGGYVWMDGWINAGWKCAGWMAVRCVGLRVCECVCVKGGGIDG